MAKKTKLRILQFKNAKCCKKARDPFKTLINGVLFLIYCFKKYFQSCFFILKRHFAAVKICEFVNSWFLFSTKQTGYKFSVEKMIQENLLKTSKMSQNKGADIKKKLLKKNSWKWRCVEKEFVCLKERITWKKKNS